MSVNLHNTAWLLNVLLDILYTECWCSLFFMCHYLTLRKASGDYQENYQINQELRFRGRGEKMCLFLLQSNVKTFCQFKMYIYFFFTKKCFIFIYLFISISLIRNCDWKGEERRRWNGPMKITKSNCQTTLGLTKIYIMLWLCCSDHW